MGVNSHIGDESTIKQGPFVIKTNIESEKTGWFSVNSHPVLVLFTPGPAEGPAAAVCASS